MVVSQGSVVSRGARWTWAGSVVLQGCAALVLVLLPLLHPERMTVGGMTATAYVPIAPVKMERVKVKPEVAASSTRAVASGMRSLAAPGAIPHGILMDDPAPVLGTGEFRGMDTGLPEGLAAARDGGVRVEVASLARAAVRGTMRVSSGVAAGMLVTPIRPVYPPTARAARVEGAVVVEATISREGRIERAHVVSGPAMLAGAALEAVKAARYSPFQLNGSATEVETTITVNFRMGG